MSSRDPCSTIQYAMKSGFGSIKKRIEPNIILQINKKIHFSLLSPGEKIKRMSGHTGFPIKDALFLKIYYFTQ